MPSMIALLAGCALTACASLPDPSHPGKAHAPDKSRPQILAGVLTRVANNAETAKDWRAAHMFYARAHDLDKANAGPLIGMGRTLLALDEPLRASEAYGGALALDPDNEEAEAGLSKSLDQLALASSRNPPADLPPSVLLAETGSGSDGTAVEATAASGATAAEDGLAEAMPDDGSDPAAADDEPAETDEPAARETDNAPAEAGPDRSRSLAVPARETEEAPAEAGAGSPSSETAENDTQTRVDMDDVLSAIEWKEERVTASPAGAEAEESRQVASAATAKRSLPDAKVMSDAGPAPAAAGAERGDLFRLQLSASTSRPKTDVLREKVETVAKDLLGGIGLDIEEYAADGGKTIYKLRTGAVGGRAAAAGLCSKLQLRAFDCFLVKADGLEQTATVDRPTLVAGAGPAREPVESASGTEPAPAPFPETAAIREAEEDDAPPMRWEIVGTTDEVPGIETEGESGEPDDTKAGEADRADGEDPTQEDADGGEPAETDPEAGLSDEEQPQQL